jgi:hypothetical protein
MPPIPKSVLKAYFEKGDKPTQSQFYSLIDSSLNLVDDMKYLGLKIYNTSLPYEPGDITVHDGIFYEAISTTSGTFDPAKWAELSTTGNAIISITHSALAALKSSGNLSPGQIYYISDKGIWIDALSDNQLNLSGKYLAVNADYQDLTENSLGIWNASLTGITPGVNFAIWNNLHWMSLTGDAGSAPDSDPTNWELIPTTDPSYNIQIDDIKYDFGLDFIFERSDKYGNFVSSVNDPSETFGLIPIERFQWGRLGVMGNVVKNSIFDIANCEAMNFSAEVTNFSIVTALDNANYSNAIISNSVVYAKFNSDLQKCIIRNSSIRAMSASIIQPGKRLEPGFSNMEVTVNITEATLLDITTISYAGIYNLTSTNGSELLGNCSGIPEHPIELRPANGLVVEILQGTGHSGEFILPLSGLFLDGSKGDFAVFRSGPAASAKYFHAVTFS